MEVLNAAVVPDVPARRFVPGPAGTHITIRGLTNELDNFVAELEVAFGHRYGDNRAIAEEISDAVETRFIRLQDAVNAQKQLITASKP